MLRQRRSTKLRRWLFLGATLTLVAAALDVAYLATIWPDWDALKKGSVPQSLPIAAYRARPNGKSRLRWRPMALADIPTQVTHAILVAEDAGFFGHAGVDVHALREAMQSNVERGELHYGGSTISQQTVKNLLVGRERTILRKWHELVLTVAMERQLSKSRILAIYLNIAEFGDGVFGVDAAAKHYFNVPVGMLTLEQAVEMAATLPSPVKHNPATRTKTFLRRKDRILRDVARSGNASRPTAKGTLG